MQKIIFVFTLFSLQLFAAEIDGYIDKKMKPIQFNIQERLKEISFSFLKPRVGQKFDISVSVNIDKKSLKSDLELGEIKSINNKVLLPGLEEERNIGKEIVRNININEALLMQNLTDINIKVYTPKTITLENMEILKNDLNSYYSSLGVNLVNIQNQKMQTLMTDRQMPLEEQDTESSRQLIILGVCFFGLILSLFIMLNSLKTAFADLGSKINGAIKKLSTGLNFNIDIPEINSASRQADDMVVTLDNNQDNDISPSLEDSAFLTFLNESIISHKLLDLHGYLKLKGKSSQNAEIERLYFNKIMQNGPNFNESQMKTVILTLYRNFTQSEELAFKFLFDLIIKDIPKDKLVAHIKDLTQNELIQFIYISDIKLSASIISDHTEIIDQLKKAPSDIKFNKADYKALVEKLNKTKSVINSNPISSISEMLPPAIEKKFNQSFSLGGDFFSTLDAKKEKVVNDYLSKLSTNALVALAPILPNNILNNVCQGLPELKAKQVQRAASAKITTASMQAKHELVKYVKSA